MIRQVSCGMLGDMRIPPPTVAQPPGSDALSPWLLARTSID